MFIVLTEMSHPELQSIVSTGAAVGGNLIAITFCTFNVNLFSLLTYVSTFSAPVTALGAFLMINQFFTSR